MDVKDSIEEENKKIDEENKKIDEYNRKVDKYNEALDNGENPKDDFKHFEALFLINVFRVDCVLCLYS